MNPFLSECPGEVYDDFDYSELESLVSLKTDSERTEDSSEVVKLEESSTRNMTEFNPVYSFNLTQDDLCSVFIKTFVLNRYNAGENCYCKMIRLDIASGTIKEATKSLYESFKDSEYQWLTHGELRFCLIGAEVALNANLYNKAFLFYGNKDKFNDIEEILYKYFAKIESSPTITWCFIDGEKISMSVKNLVIKNPPFTEMYPFLRGETLEEYYDRYNESDASILLLQGPPGTGKTTFIKGLLKHLNQSAILTYDDAILSGDFFLNNFIENRSTKFLVFEDADAYLTARERGNKIIHKFLNAGDGLISSSDKKIIFTTNLPNLTEIDEALIRPGRCFDILQFRPLSSSEALSVIQKQGAEIELPEKDYTIAELFNNQKYTKKKVKSQFGLF